MTFISKEDDSVKVTYTIVGIYQNTEDTNEDRFFSSSNQVYTNVASATTLLSEDTYNDGDYLVTNPTFYLNDPENIDKFIKEGNSLITDLSDRNLKLGINDNAYQSMIGAIEGVGSFANTVLIVVIAGAIVIISLMIINSIKDRNYEIGVLLSLGERRLKIISQILVELIMVATLAFSLSCVSSGLVSQKLGDAILDNQITSLKDSNSNIPGGNRGAMFNRFEGNNNIKQIDSIDVNVSINDIELLFICGYVIIFVSMIVPSIKILKTDPKDILSRKDV
jgi:putative ABC transport system permease protein